MRAYIKNGELVQISDDDVPVFKAAHGDDADAMLLAGTQHQGLLAIDDVYARILRELTGNASVEERDTWPVNTLGVIAAELLTLVPFAEGGHARRILAGVASVTTGREEIITSKVESWCQLVATADVIRSQSREAVRSATSADGVDAALNTASQNAAAAVAAYLAAHQAGNTE